MTLQESHTPATPKTRVCRVCGEEQLLAEFWRDRRRPNYGRTECRTCARRRLAFGAKTCAHCGGPIPKERTSDCCSRTCLLLSVGLPADFNPAWLDINTSQKAYSPAVEAEIRATLDAVMAAARARQ